jgi:hypothetical protein
MRRGGLAKALTVDLEGKDTDLNRPFGRHRAYARHNELGHGSLLGGSSLPCYSTRRGTVSILH